VDKSEKFSAFLPRPPGYSLHSADHSRRTCSLCAVDELLHTDIRMKCAAINDPAVDFIFDRFEPRLKAAGVEHRINVLRCSQVRAVQRWNACRCPPLTDVSPNRLRARWVT